MQRILIRLTIILTIILIHVHQAFAAQTDATANILTSPTLTPQPTPQSTTTNNTAAPSGPPLSLTLSLACVCLVFLAVIGVIILGVVVRKENMEAASKDKN